MSGSMVYPFFNKKDDRKMTDDIGGCKQSHIDQSLL